MRDETKDVQLRPEKRSRISSITLDHPTQKHKISLGSEKKPPVTLPVLVQHRPWEKDVTTRLPLLEARAPVDVDVVEQEL